MNISKLKQNPQIFSRIFGISPDKFDELAAKTYPLWAKAEEKRLKHPRKVRKGGGRKYSLSFEEMLAMLLLYARAYVTHAFLSALFDIDDSRVCRYFARLRPSVEAVFKLPVRNSDLSEEEILQLVVDATEQRTERRKKGCGYSEKKKAHTVKTQLVVDEKGNIVHISKRSPATFMTKNFSTNQKSSFPATPKAIWDTLERISGFRSKLPSYIRSPKNRLKGTSVSQSGALSLNMSSPH
ncbi:MAG: transposase family protein [Minisyncoccales bacterium]